MGWMGAEGQESDKKGRIDDELEEEEDGGRKRKVLPGFLCISSFFFSFFFSFSP